MSLYEHTEFMHDVLPFNVVSGIREFGKATYDDYGDGYSVSVNEGAWSHSVIMKSDGTLVRGFSIPVDPPDKCVEMEVLPKNLPAFADYVLKLCVDQSV